MSDRVAEATDLLLARRDELRGQIQELAQEFTRVNEALKALQGDAAKGQNPPVVVPGSPVGSEADAEEAGPLKTSVRIAVEVFLEGEERAWTPSELRIEIQQMIDAGYFDIRVAKLGNAVRSAIWVVQDGKAVRLSNGRALGAQWAANPQWQKLVLGGEGVRAIA